MERIEPLPNKSVGSTTPDTVAEGPKRQIRIVLFCFLILWLGSGMFVLFEMLFPENETAKVLAPLTTTAYLLHLFCWMLLGMLSNYFWNLFRTGKDWNDVKVRELALPLLVSPIVFYYVWAFVAGQRVTFALTLMAFQNGFFWQAVFAKAEPMLHGGHGPSAGDGRPQGPVTAL